MDGLLQRQQCNFHFIEKFWINFNKTGKQKQTAAYIQGRIKLLQAYWENCHKTHQDLYVIATEEDLKRKYFVDELICGAESEYCDLLGHMQEMLDNMVDAKRSPTGDALSSSSVRNTEAVAESYRLPTISLPKFSGNYTEWTSFRDLFTTLIHNNAALSDVQRLHYLKSNLLGEAESMLRHVSIDAANYRDAFESLQNRYENKRMIVTTQLKQLMALQPVIDENTTTIKRLLVGTVEVIQALKNLERPVDKWDDLLVFITTQKLDATSRKEWETSLGSSKNPPTFTELQEFLEQRICVLSAVHLSMNYKTQTARVQKPEFKSHIVKTVASNKCSFCSKNHQLAYCYAFKRQNVTNRRAFVEKIKCCFNCLKDGHFAPNCTTASKCHQCDSNHHTLLHVNQDSSASHQVIKKTSNENQHYDSPTVTTNIIQQESCQQVLLATARVNAIGPWGSTTIRVLIDQGSQATLVKEDIVQALRLKKRKMLVRITGVGNSEAGESKGVVSLLLSSKIDPEFSIMVDAFVVSKLTAVTPTFPVKSGNWSYLKNINLADPQYHQPGNIDMIIGADMYGVLLKNGIRKGQLNQPVAVNTSFGWILSGPVGKTPIPTVSVNQVMIDNETLAHQLRKFWELEEIVDTPVLTADETKCEEFFKSTTRRDAEGRYVVRLPMKHNICLGDSRKIAESQLYRLEGRLARNPTLNLQYHKFLSEYESLHHMEPVYDIQQPRSSFYLPHHGVVKESSTSTKLRVVFNASQVSSNGKSLNDNMFVGPKLQQDLSSIVLRWRQHFIVFAADIEKMYRQIRVADEDTNYQRILWRRSPDDAVTDFRLTTVTYGTASAPYLAIRTLHQLAEDEKDKYAIAYTVTCRDFYVDDILSGADTEAEALALQHQLIQLTNAGGFTLKKWISNCNRLLEVLPADYRECSIPLELSTANDVKTLGLLWHPVKDTFSIKINLSSIKNISKRTILSDIASLYDPLGWLSPSIITAKIMLQRLWNLGIDWDAKLPTELATEWQQYRQLLPALEKIEIDRWIGFVKSHRNVRLHAFCDASTKAFAAAIFVRVEDEYGNVQVSLLTSKSKVAPVRAVSLPRLELCGAVLLVRLLNNVRNVMAMPIHEIHAWTDSKIVLYWLRKEPRSWKTFVCNKVAKIQQSLDCNHWYHVASEQNPADGATRGVSPDLLIHNDLWWSGPEWLRSPPTLWPRDIDKINNIKIDEQQLERS